MNFSRSLKIYILCAVISMGTVTVLSFSTLAANYFVQGLDLSVRYTMEQIGADINTEDFPPQKLLDFYVASKWEDTPEIVQKELSPLEKHLSYSKYVERENWWDTPTMVLFVLRYDHPGNHTVFITRVIDTEAIMANKKNYTVPHVVKIILYAVAGIILFSIILIMLLRQVAKPMVRLTDWAENLTPEVLKKPTPDFHYCELNYLANIVGSSFNSVQTTLEREKKFLAHASHELRTPIAVVRSNTALMQKLLEKPNTIEKQKVVLERIMRAGYSMTELCETLLWLNRGEYKNLPISDVNLSSLLEQLTTGLNYLIKDKKVNVYTQFDQGEYRLPVTLASIVLGNLIRNAYQHTQCGTVEIIQKGNSVTISNRETCVLEDENELGFGLGLELTERIIRHYRWQYNVRRLESGRDVEIEFTTLSKNEESLS